MGAMPYSELKDIGEPQQAQQFLVSGLGVCVVGNFVPQVPRDKYTRTDPNALITLKLT